MKKYIIEDTIKALAWLLVIVAIIGIMTLFEIKSAEYQEEIWNNGICENCGGHYHLVTAYTKGEYGQVTYYVYECDECGNKLKLKNLCK